MYKNAKEQFYKILSKTVNDKNKNIINLKKYNNLIQRVKEARKGNVVNKHWLLKHYDVLTFGEKDHLIFPTLNSQILYYVPLENLFDILFDTHQAISHGGRDKMRRVLQQKYKNITFHEIQSFLNICEPCLQKRKTEKKDLEIKPVVFSHFNSGCQVDLIDLQSQTDKEYKFILVYKDDLTKFVILRALKNKTAKEVTNQIIDIFHIFGVPTLLQFKDRLLCNSIMNLKEMWPGLEIDQNKFQYKNLDRTDKDIKNMLTTWMMDRRCSNWSKGLEYVQFMKNRTFHSEIQQQ